jgi:acetylornithine deacetylase/succinyl-diaminopimelate desuccinylase-like protein
MYQKDSIALNRYLHKWMEDNLQAEVVRTSCGDAKNPLVCARVLMDPKFPTVTIYGHYDVQPARRVRGICVFFFSSVS